MNLPIVLFLAFGVLFGLATYSNRHLFSEGSTRRGAGRGDPLDGRLAWVAGCALLWPLLLLTGLYGAWYRSRVRAAARSSSRRAATATRR
ncbi:MAG: hypothetical protein ACK5UM_07745 [Pseudomonadota bacterium]|jgi:hypothetical protein